jgi:hypothetical protein
MRKVTGGDLPASIWKAFITEAMKLPEFGPPAADQQLMISTIRPEPEQETAPRVPAEAIIMGGFGWRTSSRALASCDYEACSMTYRSFRPADCSYQPYSGERRLCSLNEDAALDDSYDDEQNVQLAESAAEEEDFEDEFDDDYGMTEEGDYCNYEACSGSYQSFRASDCSYKAYSGRRKFCRK